MALIIALAAAPNFGERAAAAEPDYGWAEMQGDIAMRVTQNGGEVTRLIVGESYRLQVWLQNIAPYALALPLAYNPAVVTVTDPQTGAPIPSGKKTEGSSNGFTVGGKCYEYGYDYATYEPLYWNGLPVYTRAEEAENEGYPYLDAESGHYRFLYYVSSPNMPKRAQLFLELCFTVNAVGDPDFHIASYADGAGRYDPAEPDGASVILRDSSGEAYTVYYGTDISCPRLEVFTPGGYEDETNRPADDVFDEERGNRGDITPPAPDYSEPIDESELIKSERQRYFPYKKYAAVTAELRRNGSGNITRSSGCILPHTEVSRLINKGLGGYESLLVQMPERLVQGSEYSLELSARSFDDLARGGVGMLYVETPWCVLGLNTALAAAETKAEDKAELTVASTESGVKISLRLNGNAVKGFHGAALRVILPAREEWFADGAAAVPFAEDVFAGTGEKAPMSLNKLDKEHGCLIFIASSFGEYTAELRQEISFIDTDGVSWAEDDINYLARLGIIEGVGENRFEPMSPVMREQFAALLVRLFGMYDASADTAAFADVSPDGWYAHYVASAKSAGLVSGVGAERFGTGAKITRQDLAVMLYRALAQLGVKLDGAEDAESAEGAQPFADIDETADYAREAVLALSRAGLINGVSEGVFAPERTATRAEAAKLLNAAFSLRPEL